jgi:hypothetical protein
MLINFSVAGSAVISMLVAILAYDRILRWLYANDRGKWIELGSPTGCYFRPDGATFWAGCMNRSMLGMRLLFWRPSCIAGIQAVSRDIWIYRAAYVVALTCFVAVIYLS